MRWESVSRHSQPSYDHKSVEETGRNPSPHALACTESHLGRWVELKHGKIIAQVVWAVASVFVYRGGARVFPAREMALQRALCSLYDGISNRIP